jgi:hypothetical protein
MRLVRLDRLDRLDALNKNEAFELSARAFKFDRLDRLKLLRKYDRLVTLLELLSIDDKFVRLLSMLGSNRKTALELSARAFKFDKLDRLKLLRRYDRLVTLLELLRIDDKFERLLSMLGSNRKEAFDDIARLDRFDMILGSKRNLALELSSRPFKLERLERLKLLMKKEKLDRLPGLPPVRVEMVFDAQFQLEALESLSNTERLLQLFDADEMRVARLDILDRFVMVNKLENVAILDKLLNTDELLNEPLRSADKFDKLLPFKTNAKLDKFDMVWGS